MMSLKDSYLAEVYVGGERVEHEGAEGFHTVLEIIDELMIAKDLRMGEVEINIRVERDEITERSNIRAYNLISINDEMDTLRDTNG